MVLAVAPLTDVTDWARGKGLEIVILVLLAVLLARSTRWVEQRVTGSMDARSSAADVLVRSEAAKHRHAVAQVLAYVVIVLIYTLTAVGVVQRLGIPLTGLVAPATVLGVALGFGAQRLVQDVLAGFFLVAERQYGYGDVIRIAVAGGITAVTGTVEDLTLRVTTVRTSDGDVVLTPNGSIVQVTNLSRDWARAVVDVPVPVTADVAAVSATLSQVGADAFADPDLHPLLLDEPTVMGVESLSVDELNIRLVARTLPGKQFEVGRALRARIALALRAQGVALAPGLETVEPGGRA